MTFARIDILFLFWALPLLAVACIHGVRKRRNALSRFARDRSLAIIAPTAHHNRRRLRTGVILAALFLLIVSAAGPRYGYHWQENERKGIDMMIALDCSRSMLANDMPPTRLDRAKREIYDLLAMLQGDRVGLVAFSGSAFLQCPLTIDYQAFNLFLEVLGPDYLPVGGSDLHAAVQTAIEGLSSSSSAGKAIILITDGEHTGDASAQQAARIAAEAGIKLFCIGVGGASGVPVPAAGGGFKKDKQGQIVLSRLDEPLLTRMALATGGTYVRSVAGDMDLDVIYRDQIRSGMDSTRLESGRRRVETDRFQWPLLLAVVLMFTFLEIPLEKATRTAGLAFVLVCAAQPQAQAGPLQEGYRSYLKGEYEQALELFVQGQPKNPEDPAVLYNIGNAYYKTGRFEAARNHYAQALGAADEALKAKLLYNLGNTAYRSGRLEEAIQNYEAVLRLQPDDKQARDNLAYVRRQLKNRKQQNARGNGQGQRQSLSQGRGSGQPPEKDGRPQQAPGQQPPAPSSGTDTRAGRQDPAGEAQRPGPQKSAAARRPKDARTQHGPAVDDRILNRLKDEPGRALIPDYHKRPVEKDW